MPDDPEQQAAPTPLTTEARVGGLVREQLVARATGELKVGGLVREALVAGLGLAGRVTIQSRASAYMNTTLNLAGRVTAMSRGSLAAIGHVLLSGQITAMTSARASPTYTGGGAKQYAVNVNVG